MNGEFLNFFNFCVLASLLMFKLLPVIEKMSCCFYKNGMGSANNITELHIRVSYRIFSLWGEAQAHIKLKPHV